MNFQKYYNMNDAQIILQLILIFIQTILFGLSLLYTTILPFILWAAFYFITKLNFIIQLI